MYRSLAQDLRTKVLRGEFRDGQRLPTEAELADEHGVSRQTVRRAFQELVTEGLVYRIRGKGTFPAERDGAYLRQFGSIEDLMGLSEDTRLKITEGLRTHVDVNAAGRLRLASDTVTTLNFVRLYDDVPFCHTKVYLPPDVADLIRHDGEALVEGAISDATIIELVDKRLDAPIVEAMQSITVAEATAEVAEQLGCSESQPLLYIDRLYLDGNQRPIELAISHFLPHLYSYRLRLRRSVR